jgi:chemotaxis methyl-accepting protein methylase
MTDVLKPLNDLFLQDYGIDITIYEDSFLVKSLEKCMDEAGSKSFQGYCQLIKSNSSAAEHFIGSLNNTYSSFFRNSLTFACLENLILPELLKRKNKTNEKELRIWSAACSAGQESYSIAILLNEFLEATNSSLSYRIFATDINVNQLKIAEKGIFDESWLSNVTLSRLKNYFIQNKRHYEIHDKLKKHIDFSYFDLLNDKLSCPPESIFGNFDIIILSNLLFYYKTSTRSRILSKIENCLSRGGYLFTSESEREILKLNNYNEVFLNSGIFRKSKANKLIKYEN